MTGLRLPEPEHFDFVSEAQVRELIASAEHEFADLGRAASETKVDADLAEEQARSAGVDPRLSTRTMLRLQRFLDELRAEVERETTEVVSRAHLQAQTRIEAAWAVAAARPAPSGPVAPSDPTNFRDANSNDIDRLRRLLFAASAAPSEPASSAPSSAPSSAATRLETPVEPPKPAPAAPVAGPPVEALVVEQPPAARNEPVPEAPPRPLVAPVLIRTDEPRPAPEPGAQSSNGISGPTHPGPNGQSAWDPATVLPDDAHPAAGGEDAPPHAYRLEPQLHAPYEPPPDRYQPGPNDVPTPAMVQPAAAPSAAPRHRRIRVPMATVLEVLAVLLVLGFLLLRLS